MVFNFGLDTSLIATYIAVTLVRKLAWIRCSKYLKKIIIELLAGIRELEFWNR
jgi:hypothetical protein